MRADEHISLIISDENREPNLELQVACVYLISTQDVKEVFPHMLL